MTWEEIILRIRKDPEYATLVEQAYLGADLRRNVESFHASDEFRECMNLIREHFPSLENLRLADIGAGNGIASASFALEGFHVTALEPDPSLTVGAGAIRELKNGLHLDHLEIRDEKGEGITATDRSFDVVYIRQAMHHADDLGKFIKEASRILKPGGILLTTRDHVIYNEEDKAWFLREHPLHKFYGGENAYTINEYKSAIISAGLTIKRVLRHFDSVINYFPLSAGDLDIQEKKQEKFIESLWRSRVPAFLRSVPGARAFYIKRARKKLGPANDERKIPGRLISFLAVKAI